VQDSTHLVGRKVYIALTRITDQEPVTIPMPLNTAFNFFQQAAGWRYFFDIQSFYS